MIAPWAKAAAEEVCNELSCGPISEAALDEFTDTMATIIQRHAPTSDEMLMGALIDCYDVLVNSGQLEVHVPKSLVAVFDTFRSREL